MIFSSTVFISFFLPIATALYFIVPKRLKNYWLFFVSIFFYSWGEPKFVFVMVGSIFFNWLAALLLSAFDKKPTGRKVILFFSIFCNLLLLFVFKYLNFTIENLNKVLSHPLPQTNIPLPIGISFFTFQAMSYVIDVYRKDVKVQKNPIYIGMYIAFFPQLIAGPIVRYSTIEEQVSNRKTTLTGLSVGVNRFLIGFSKKVLLANTMAVVADRAFAGESNAVAFAWLGAVAYTLQIFFDFSAYSDMAIGLGRIFGFTFLENFNYPYISKSISEFWRRWHISLGTWFRDYVYFPLGGSRVKSKARLIFNLFVVWLLTGIWHGANWTFVLWGLLNFLFIAGEKITNFPTKSQSQISQTLYRISTILFIILGWVLFRSPNLQTATQYLKDMFHLSGNSFFDSNFYFYSREYLILFGVGILLSFPLVDKIKDKFAFSNYQGLTLGINFFSIILHLILFLISLSHLVMGAHNPFIYFNF